MRHPMKRLSGAVLELALFRKTGALPPTREGARPHPGSTKTNPIGDSVRDTSAGDPADGPLRADPFAQGLGQYRG
jgi:hypothetical protein